MFARVASAREIFYHLTSLFEIFSTSDHMYETIGNFSLTGFDHLVFSFVLSANCRIHSGSIHKYLCSCRCCKKKTPLLFNHVFQN